MLRLLLALLIALCWLTPVTTQAQATPSEVDITGILINHSAIFKLTPHGATRIIITATTIPTNGQALEVATFEQPLVNETIEFVYFRGFSNRIYHVDEYTIVNGNLLLVSSKIYHATYYSYIPIIHAQAMQ